MQSAARWGRGSPELIGGVVAKGRKVDGWVAFEVSTGTKALWIDYAPGAGPSYSA